MMFVRNNLLLHFSAAILIMVICVGCSSVKNLRELRFGSGGGFTNEIKTYSIDREGKLTELKGDQKVLLKTVEKQKLKELYRLADKLKTFKLNNPSNVYYFIEIETKENTNRLVWGVTDTEISEDIKKLNIELNSLIK